MDLNTACNIIRDCSTTGQIEQKQYVATKAPSLQSDVDLMAKFKFTREMATFQREYLGARRYDPDEVFTKYNLHFAGPIGEFARKIIIPITHQGKIVSFLGKTAAFNVELPYKNCPDKDSLVSVKDTLYDLDNCNGSTVLVVEGVFDKWRLGGNVAATFGTKFTDAQVGLLKDFKRVFILFDTEPTAQAQAKELCNRLAIYTEVIQLQLESGDPDDLSDDDVKHLRKQVFKTIF